MENRNTALLVSKEIDMSTIDSFYSPEEHQAFEYHRKLLKIAEQERLARQITQTHDDSRHPSLGKHISVKERFLSLFGARPNHSTLGIKEASRAGR